MSQEIRIVDVYAENPNGWFDCIRSLMDGEQNYHRKLDSADPEELSAELYDVEAECKELAEESARTACFVAYKGEEALGFITLFVRPKESCVPYETGYIMDFYLAEQHRGRGVGGMLFEKALAWFESQPTVRHITLEAWAGNEKVIPLYEKYGFKIHYYDMTRPNKNWKKTTF